MIYTKWYSIRSSQHFMENLICSSCISNEHLGECLENVICFGSIKIFSNYQNID